jgi:hypothetical protein
MTKENMVMKLLYLMKSKWKKLKVFTKINLKLIVIATEALKEYEMHA